MRVHCLLLSIAALAALAPCAAVAQDTVLRYDASITPVRDSDLAAALEASSNLIALEGEPVAGGMAGLIRRVRADTERLMAALRSFGYYRGSITGRIGTYDLDDPALAALVDAPEQPVAVTLVVETGPLYRIAEITLLGPDGDPSPVPIDRSALPLRPGDPARSAVILDAETRLVAQMRATGHPFAVAPGREAVVDHATEEMFLTWTLDPGPAATMGEVTFEGLDQIRLRFAQRRVPFEVGDPFDPALLSALRDSLTDTGVFSTISVRPAESLTDEGRLPVTVVVTERPSRVIGFGGDYSTTEGIRLRAHWGHRNLFGGAESVRVEGEVGRIAETDEVGGLDYRLNVDLRKPDLFRADQDLVGNFALLSENPDAFERRALQSSVGLERDLSDTLTAGAGLSFEYSRVEQVGETDRFFLIGLPLSLRYDGTDDLLNPTAGARVDLSVTPYPVWLGSSRNLLISRATATGYQDFGSDGRTVLAGRVSIGSLWGEDRDNVPAHKRFYTGGGGSVRGYDFQGIGPHNAEGDPLGGRSLFEASVELRYRLTETIGIVPFVDAGAVYDSTFPDFSEPLRFGAGIGARYHTGFGPIRLDIAVPVNRGEEDDGSFSVYVSIGQAF